MGEERTARVVDEGGAGEELRLRLAGEFAAFGPEYMRWVRACVPEGGPSYARMRLLGALRCGEVRIMSDLSGELGVTPRNVTALVDALEEEGLVRRRHHPTDRRATVVQLTERGTGACEGGGFEGHAEAVAALFGALSEGEARELLRLLGKLRGALRREGSAS
jgi:DNA-binding MarR family transcriptional regulator